MFAPVIPLWPQCFGETTETGFRDPLIEAGASENVSRNLTFLKLLRLHISSKLMIPLVSRNAAHFMLKALHL